MVGVSKINFLLALSGQGALLCCLFLCVVKYASQISYNLTKIPKIKRKSLQLT